MLLRSGSKSLLSHENVSFYKFKRPTRHGKSFYASFLYLRIFTERKLLTTRKLKLRSFESSKILESQIPQELKLVKIMCYRAATYLYRVNATFYLLSKLSEIHSAISVWVLYLQQFSIWTAIRRFCIHRRVFCIFSSHISLLPFKFTNRSRLSCRNGLMFNVMSRLFARFMDLRLGIRWNNDAYKWVIWLFWRSSVWKNNVIISSLPFILLIGKDIPRLIDFSTCWNSLNP